MSQGLNAAFIICILCSINITYLYSKASLVMVPSLLPSSGLTGGPGVVRLNTNILIVICSTVYIMSNDSDCFMLGILL